MKPDRVVFALIAAYQVCIWWVVRNDPFFGDAISSTAQAATHIYQQQLTTLFYPLTADPGHPTLYSYLLALIWTVTNYSLPVAHAYSCIWAGFLLWSVFVFAKQFLSITQSIVALVGCLLFATTLSQSAMVLNTVALMAFFIQAVIAVVKHNRLRLIVAALLMCVTHLQAPFLLLSLFCFDAYRTFFRQQDGNFIRFITSRMVVYSIPIMCWFGWLYAHYLHAGWFLHSPYYTDADTLNGPKEWIKAMFTICMRLFDYGMIACYLAIVYAGFTNARFRRQLVSWVILLLPLCVTMAVFLNNTIGHRYFLGYQLLVIVGTVYAIEQLKLAKPIVAYGLVGACIFLGNWLHYPGKTLGDATLAYRSYFALEEQVLAAYPNTTFYTHAPIANPYALTHLQPGRSAFVRLNKASFDTIPAILQSNINAEFSEKQKAFLTQNWYGESFESGAVYATVFLNPAFYPNQQVRQFRKPSTIELMMINLKLKWKGNQ